MTGAQLFLVFGRSRFADVKTGERVGIYGTLHGGIGNMRVDLGGIELLMTEDILEYADINVTALVHQRGGGMAQLTWGSQ